MIAATVEELTPIIGTRPACRAVGASVATIYRRRRRMNAVMMAVSTAALAFGLDKHGKGLTLRFRCMEDHDHRAFYHGKMNSLPDDPTRLYNIGAVLKADNEIHLAEGEPDTWVLEKLGYPTLGIPGVHNWKFHHTRILAGFSRVYLWADPDEAGRAASLESRK